MTPKWYFQIEGEVRAYVRTTQRMKWVDPRYKRYQQWCSYVRAVANEAGVPADLVGEWTYGIGVLIGWSGRARMDSDNVLKGILDALWDNDRRCLDVSASAREFCGSDRIHVSIAVQENTDERTKQ